VKLLGVLLADDLGDLAGLVRRVAELAGTDGADLDAGRELALVDAVVAPGALVRDAGRRLAPGAGLGRDQVAGTVRAGHDAVAAADAPAGVHQDHAVLGVIRRPDRAHRGARGVDALHAQARLEVRCRDWLAGGTGGGGLGREAVDAAVGGVHVEGPVGGRGVTLHPGPGAHRLLDDVVLLLARDDTQAASDARGGVHDKRPLLARGVVGGDDRAGGVQLLCEDRDEPREHRGADEPPRDREAEPEERAAALGDDREGRG
jgi:hypothetical protein